MRLRVLLLCFVVLVLTAQGAAATWDASGFEERITYTVNKSMVSGSHSQMPIGFQLNVSGLDVNTSVVQVYLPNGTRLAIEKEHYTDPYGLYWVGALDINDTVDYEFLVYYGDVDGVEPAADNIYGANNVWNGYTAVWLMNTDPTSNIKDSTGNGYTAIANGFVAGDLLNSTYGKELNFDSNFLEIGRVTALEGTAEDFTVGVYGRYDASTPNAMTLWGYSADDSPSPPDEYTTYFSTVFGGMAWGSPYYDAGMTDELNNHLMTFGRSTNNFVAHLDGVNTLDTALAGYAGSASHVFKFGDDYNNNFMNGKIEFAYIHPDDLSDNYQTTQFKSINNPSATGTDPFYSTISAPETSTTNPDINTILISPINNTYTQHNNFTFNIVGNFTTANATLFIDTVERWNGSITTGSNTASNITLTEGLHSWYINATATASGNTTYNQSSNASFYYDISNPTVPTVQINPDYATISDGTIVNINLSWADNLQLKNGTFYIDTGSGYSEDSNTTLSGVSDWFNTSINTSGMVGNIITWKQEVYDQASNNYTYSDSFYVALPSLLIYVYDETTGKSVLPSDVTVYNEDVSRSATINGSTNISTLDYGNFTTDKYIVRVSADGYYTRRSIALIDIETISSLNVYLPDLNETVIFDQFILTDNTLLYDLSNCIIKLDKPLPNGTDTVFSSYFDFDGVASTYLIATDQYILYIETPDSVISYGWLTPDADGQIEIVITDPIEDLLDDWLSYSLTKSDAGSISLTYESEVEIGTAVFYVNTTGGATLYTASISADSGSFTYAADVNESYWVSFTVDNVDGDVKTVTRLIFWNEEGVQPVRMPLLPDGAPDWFYNLLSVGTVIIVILLFSQIRADAACVIGAAFSGLFWYWGWMKVSGIVIAVAALIAIAAIMYKSRREGI